MATQTVDKNLIDTNLTNPDLYRYEEPREVWRALRQHDPVHWNPGTDGYPGYWSITKYADIVAISRNPKVFSSASGIGSTSDPTQPDLPGAVNKLPGRFILVTDPPLHIALRRLVSKGFTPRQVTRLEPLMRSVTAQILDEKAPLGRCDFFREMGGQLPLAVIGELAGVPRSDFDYAFDITEISYAASSDISYSEMAANAQHRQERSLAYFRDLVSARRKAPTDDEDIINVLLKAQAGEPDVTDDDVIAFVNGLNGAGNRTTRTVLCAIVDAFTRYEDQRQKVLDDPSLVASAVEEVLRWHTPVRSMARFVMEDTEIRGQKIKKGEKVMLWWGSANYDEEVFEDPDRFDVTRTPNEHLAFGIGEHYCIGSSLARLEIRIFVEEMLKRLPDIRVEGTPERTRGEVHNSYRSFDVTYTPN